MRIRIGCTLGVRYNTFLSRNVISAGGTVSSTVLSNSFDTRHFSALSSKENHDFTHYNRLISVRAKSLCISYSTNAKALRHARKMSQIGKFKRESCSRSSFFLAFFALVMSIITIVRTRVLPLSYGLFYKKFNKACIIMVLYIDLRHNAKCK